MIHADNHHRFVEKRAYYPFFKNRMKLARAKRKIDNVGDNRNENRSTGLNPLKGFDVNWLQLFV